MPKAASHKPAMMPGPIAFDGLQGATVAPLPERIDALNYSMDPWERIFWLVAAWVRSRAERPSVSYTKVTAKSQGLAK